MLTPADRALCNQLCHQAKRLRNRAAALTDATDYLTNKVVELLSHVLHDMTETPPDPKPQKETPDVP